MNLDAFTPEMRKHTRKTPEGYYAFIPPKLPPTVEIDWHLASRISDADRAISQLGGVARTLPNPHLLISPFTHREAVLSSRIEGTQATLSDLFTYEASPSGVAPTGRASRADVQEVHNYVVALNYGLERVNSLPISSRLIREMHERLMRGVRGEQATPGQFRKSQNWIGAPGCLLKEAAYVPPPPHEMQQSLNDLEKFLHADHDLPPLVQMAMAHYQFEAIHPFLDGNGRIGRLLLVLLMCDRNLLPAPLLYLSAYFERNRSQYYSCLLGVSQRGDWTTWIKFFLAAVETQSNDAVDRSYSLIELQKRYREQLLSTHASSTSLRLLDHLFSYPAVTMGFAASLLESTARTAQMTIDKLLDLGILQEITGQKRNRIYMANEIVRVLEAPNP